MNGLPSRFAVVLAGGEGSRFWPASRHQRPKQLLPLGGEHPLIRETVLRAARLVGIDSVRVIAGRDFVESLRLAAPELTEAMVLVEPAARSTGPALAWAAFELERAHPGALMVSLHSDHAIEPVEELVGAFERAAEAARRGSLVCIGVKPDRPDTGYGYVERGEPTGERTWRARQFAEKPDREAAEAYVASGRFLWNTGIFVWKAEVFLEAVRTLAPEISAALPLLATDGPQAFFGAVEAISVDVAVLERSAHIEVVEAGFAWDDVGSWNALRRTRPLDGAGNVLVGQVLAVESADNVAWAEDGDLVLFGVRDLVVVRSGGRTLVTTLEAAPHLKRLIKRVQDWDGSI
jgi:mannose-1-phosphate guanylyltransferase